MNNIELDLYVVRNKDGKFLRSKGYGGSGGNWVDEIKQAKIWNKIGTARAQVSFWANNYPKYGTPELLKLTIAGFEVLDETERVEKVKTAKELAKQRAKIYEAEYKLAEAKKQKEEAEQAIKDATKTLGKKVK